MNDKEQLAFLRDLRNRIDNQIKRIEMKDLPRPVRPLSYRVDYIPAKEIAPYINEWLEQGFTYALLASRSGVGVKTLGMIASGQQEWVKKTTAEKILVIGLSLYTVFSELDAFEWDKDA